MVSIANGSSADLFEVRLDHLGLEQDLNELGNIEKPLIATCMPHWEGGFFQGREEDRMKRIEEALDYVQFATIELNTERKLLDEFVSRAREFDVKVIVAFHDFESTPDNEILEDVLGKEFDEGADIAKIACMAKSHADMLELMKLQSEQEPDKTIMVSMGDFGRPSRAIAPMLGSYLTYCSIDGGEVAPGQLSVEEMSKLKKILW